MTEWHKETMAILNLAIPMVWEGLGRTVKGCEQRIRAVLMVNANKDPSDLKLEGANRSKVNFICTGKTALDHPNRMEIVQGGVVKYPLNDSFNKFAIRYKF